MGIMTVAMEQRFCSQRDLMLRSSFRRRMVALDMMAQI